MAHPDATWWFEHGQTDSAWRLWHENRLHFTSRIRERVLQIKPDATDADVEDAIHMAIYRFEYESDRYAAMTSILEAIQPAPPVIDPTIVDGNFLALKGFELGRGQAPGFVYPGMLPGDRRRYRQEMKNAGLVTIPFAPWTKYQQWQYNLEPEAFFDILQEVTADGLAPLAFLITDKVNGAPWTVDEIKDTLDRHLSVWVDAAVSYAMAWEIDQIRGLAHENDQLEIMRHARQIIGAEATLWDHRQPRWWGPGLTDANRTEWNYWRETPCDGLLGQEHIGQKMSDSLEYWFESIWDGKSLGVAGRLTQYLGKRCAMFEFARERVDWANRKGHNQQHPHAGWLSGYC